MGIFSSPPKPKVPPLPKPPPPSPTIADADVQQAGTRAKRRAASGGRASTILTSPLGLTGPARTTKTLLGT